MYIERIRRIISEQEAQVKYAQTACDEDNTGRLGVERGWLVQDPGRLRMHRPEGCTGAGSGFEAEISAGF